MSYISKIANHDWKYPLPQEANAEGYCEVSKNPLHKIYWHEYGNPQGEPVFYIHGGPGGGTEATDARFFDPARYRIILFDQRGCGKSAPSAATDPVNALKANTTSDLIGDIEKLRIHLATTGKMHIFGGSWGSTLSLAYAMEYPHHVRTLILRGIFLCRRKDLDYFYQGNANYYEQAPYDARVPGTYIIYPEPWKEFVELIPPGKRGDMVKAYAEIFARTPGNEEERRQQDRAAITWSVWEGSTSYVAQDLSDPGKFAEPEFAKAFARIENHYFMNGAFLGGGSGEIHRDNNYLLENAGRIAHLPTYIVQGRYDEVCPRFGADELVAALKANGAKQIEYIVTSAGHSAREAENVRALTAIMDNLPC